MSLHATRAAWRVRVPNGREVSGRTAHHVLLAMADECRNGRDWVFISAAQLAENTRYGERTVRRALQHLRGCGIVTVAKRHRPGKSTGYRFGAWFHALPMVGEKPATVAARTGHGGRSEPATVAALPGSREIHTVVASDGTPEPDRTAAAQKLATIRSSRLQGVAKEKRAAADGRLARARRDVAAGGGV